MVPKEIYASECNYLDISQVPRKWYIHMQFARYLIFSSYSTGNNHVNQSYGMFVSVVLVQWAGSYQ